MDAVPVLSSAFSQIQFDERHNTVTVTFKNGSTDTRSCDRQTYEEFLAAPSKGRFWHQQLKKSD